MFCCSLIGFAFFGHSTSLAAVCSSALVDPDGDGWGWENNRSCEVSSDSEVVDQQVQAGLIPICSSASADNDSDGWGWENNRTCIVGDNASPLDNAESAISSAIQSNTTFDNCSSNISDEDGDGWGWENNRSCIVVANASSVGNAEPEVSSAMQSSNTFDNCSSSAGDEDGDGWGWENNRSCIVPQTTEQLSEATSVDVVQPVDGSLVNTVRFMVVGDSITHGTPRNNAQSYRKPLIDLFESNSCQYEMLGSQTGNFGHASFVSPHEGYNGYTADQLLYGHNGAAGQSEGIGVVAARYQPEVMLLHVGTNDMRLGQDVEQTIAEIDQIVNTFLSINPYSTVFLANLVPWYLGAQSQVQLLGDRIESYVAQQSDTRVRLVDVRTGYTLSMMLSDRVHPNPVGEAHIASAFFRSIKSGGFCR